MKRFNVDPVGLEEPVRTAMKLKRRGSTRRTAREGKGGQAAPASNIQAHGRGIGISAGVPQAREWRAKAGGRDE